ncbi:hypothetical protein DEO72_LG7g1466 [Vigna unguiculata]|uniref:Uncharacterized protein n=1 Tax=Vigna unguiculata TaxID=3917 RepID=A0A4D6MJ20_VIGUN|nr:hypothetical protein DEO72_LG7g1466 [Vigna unguiculata]
MFIRHLEPQLKGFYSEPQLKGYVLSHNSRNPNKPNFKAPLKRCRPRTSRQATPLLNDIAWRNTLGAKSIRPPNCLAGDTCRQAQSASSLTALHLSPSWTLPTARRHACKHAL